MGAAIRPPKTPTWASTRSKLEVVVFMICNFFLLIYFRYIIVSEEDWVALSACYPCKNVIAVIKARDESGQTEFIIDPRKREFLEF